MSERGPQPAQDLLRSLSLFSQVREEVLAPIADRTVIRKVPQSRLVFRKGDPCEGLFVVVKGRVRVYRANAEGKEQVIHDQGPGDTLAEVPLFDGGPYPAHARAEEDSELLFLPRAEFQAAYRAEPEIAHAVILELGRRLRKAVRLIEKISLRDVTARVGLTLLEYAQGPAESSDEVSDTFILPVSQAQMAESLATTRESVARALRALREEGLIEQRGASVRIPSSTKLEDRCYGL